MYVYLTIADTMCVKEAIESVASHKVTMLLPICMEYYILNNVATHRNKRILILLIVTVRNA